MQASSLMADFDDEDSDETEGSGGSSSTAASAAAAATAANRSLRLSASPDSAGGVDMDSGGGGRQLESPGMLEDAYLQLTHSLAQHNQRAGRVRAAARCWGKRAELLLERGEVGIAHARLASLADLYQVCAKFVIFWGLSVCVCVLLISLNYCLDKS